jgi:hypothetical protein
MYFFYKRVRVRTVELRFLSRILFRIADLWFPVSLYRFPLFVIVPVRKFLGSYLPVWLRMLNVSVSTASVVETGQEETEI